MQQWVALTNAGQLRNGCQLFVFQPESACQPDVRGAIPPPIKPGCSPCAPTVVRSCSPCGPTVVNPCNPCAPVVANCCPPNPVACTAATEIREAERRTTEHSVRSF